MDAKIVKVPTQAELDRIVSAVFPEWSQFTAELLKGGLFNTTYLLRSDDTDKKYILRCGPVHRELLLPYEIYLMDAECWAYEKMAEIGIPTSTVIYKDTTKTLLDRDFMVVEYIESTQLHRAQTGADVQYKVYYNVGAYTRKMTEIRTEKFGRVGHILNGGGYDTWGEYIKSELTEWAQKIREQTTGYYTEEELNEIVSIADRYRDILDEIKTPCFNHCDLWMLNVLLTPEENGDIAAIIDPDRACMGDPDFELSSGWMMNDAFYDGYGRRMSEDEHTVIRTNIYKMMFLILDGYFQRVQYDDPAPSMNDKERAMEYINQLTGDR